MRPSGLVSRLGPASTGFVAGAAAAGGLTIGFSLAMNYVAGLAVVISLSPVVLLLGLLCSAAGRRTWLLGLASGVALGSLFWYWVFAVLSGSTH